VNYNKIIITDHYPYFGIFDMPVRILLLLTLLLSGCTQFFFFPSSALIDTPKRYGIQYQSENIKAADGTKLNAWFLPASSQVDHPKKPTILFLHGNAENISTHFRNVAWLPAAGFNVLALDYRGYGASEGIPNLDGIQLDIDAAMQSLLTHPGVDPNNIIIFGQSLGGALAIYYAAHNSYRAHIKAVVIDSSFFDYRGIAREKMASSWILWPFQWLPWLVINDNYSPANSVALISPIPLLLIHGDKDNVIPFHDSQQLFERAQEPKELWIVPGANHTQSLNSAIMQKKLIDYLKLKTSK
jgi:hypothetical protein